jgi:ABC-type transport system involved in multi-copper enzyme maturation permease subunit
MGFVTTLARITVLEALRDRLLWLAAIVVLAGIALAAFLREVAITESREIETAVLAALLRVAAVFIVSIAVISSMTRESNDKITDLLMSFPVPRSRYVLGKFLGYAAVAALLSLVFTVPLAFYSRSAGVLAWGASLLCELLIVAAVCVFCVLTLARTLSALSAVAGFYLLARSMSAIQIMAQAAPPGSSSLADRVMARGVDLVALALPALDRMTDTAWLLHGAPGADALVSVAAQTGVYVVLVGAAALFDLYRKNL